MQQTQLITNTPKF